MAIQDWKAYQKALDFLRLRSRAYKLTFTSAKDSEVLKDLEKFCRIGQSVFHSNPRKTDVLIGRQEVYHRIMHHLNLQPDELYELYNPNQTPQQEEPTND